MFERRRRGASLPHKTITKEPAQQARKSRVQYSPFTSRAQSKQLMLRFDINTLLSLFNQLDSNGIGEISVTGVAKILQTVGLSNYEHYLHCDSYTFDHFLSVLGQIEIPNEPSVYVLSFVKILANYRDKCLQNQEEGLEEAQAVQQKIKGISRNELSRQRSRINQEHSIIYQEMQRSQQEQFVSFEQEWNTYLKQFKEETNKKLQETRYIKRSKVMEEEARFLSKSSRNNVLTSPWLRELHEKKKWLIHDKKFQDAIEVSNEINRQRVKLNQEREQLKEVVLHKKLVKLTKQTNRYIDTIQKNLQMDFSRLMSKKKEGEAIMRIRMKKLREEANRKLNDHYRSEMNRLRSSFFMVANH